MKTSSKLFALGMILMGFGLNANAQSTDVAQATAAARIISPITITKTADMNFGIIAADASTAGTVILATDNTRTPSVVTLPPTSTGTVSPAVFTVTGESGFAYVITLPTSPVVLTHTNGTDVMTATAFNSDGGTTLSSSSFTLKVGATLNIGANQASGTYTSEDFDVTVNYN